ncbi:MAG: GGDEF domain-containing protein [Desulfobulbaceae bacterium]|nr:GGDEF domain-containing protein [Desulfobulbaceae bacterium]
MEKVETDAKDILNKLGSFSSYLVGLDATVDMDECFRFPLEVMRQAMAFDVSVLYKITNVVDNRLILEIVRLFDPEGYRSDLREGKKLILDIDQPELIFVNEVKAYKSRKISSINVPGAGCDMVGSIYLPGALGGGYLFGGDYCGQESAIRDYEESVCEVMCNLLSTTLIKTQFEQLAVYDSLTGLRNSRSIKEEVQRICNRFGRKAGSMASIALCDIDHFKKVNDTYGHIQGDVILSEVGKILSDSMRKHFDMAGRYGGEEFLLIFDETGSTEGFEVVERIRETIAAYRFSRCDGSGKLITGESLSITMSFGVAEKGGKSGDGDDLEWISRADRALYQSKHDGRNRTTCQ